jgi:hypothetical protein
VPRVGRREEACDERYIAGENAVDPIRDLSSQTPGERLGDLPCFLIERLDGNERLAVAVDRLATGEDAIVAVLVDVLAEYFATVRRGQDRAQTRLVRRRRGQHGRA